MCSILGLVFQHYEEEDNDNGDEDDDDVEGDDIN